MVGIANGGLNLGLNLGLIRFRAVGAATEAAMGAAIRSTGVGARMHHEGSDGGVDEDDSSGG